MKSMATRADVDRINKANKVIVSLARRDLAKIFNSLNLGRPEQVRDVLLEIVPAIVDRYGSMSATAAAEWYEWLRLEAVGRTTAVVAPMSNLAEAKGSVRYAAGHLFTDNPANTLAILDGAIQRHILYGARETIRRNVDQDRSRPRWARVPSGAHTCAFCLMLASRGFAYHSRESAGHMASYHDDCDCMIVPEWESTKAIIDGYDPDRWYDMFQNAVNVAGTTNTRTVLAELRQLYPETVTN